MIPCPVVLIISETEYKTADIAKSIIQNNHKNETIEVASNDAPEYLLHLTTKYYKTELRLFPFESDLNALPKEILERTEAVLIYFDSKQKSFRNRISIYSEFLATNNIELGVLLCEKLCDESTDGITYAEARQHSNLLDVVELEKISDSDSTTTEGQQSIGYDELIEILKNYIWSNVNIVRRNNTSAQNSTDDSIAEGNVEAEQVSNSEDTSIENEMNMFENLLSEVMMFKNASANLSRNERLLYAENFAEKFEKLLDLSSGSDDDT